MGLKTKSTAFVSPDPSEDSFLPCDDQVWIDSSGDYKNVKLSEPYSSHVGTFARAAQASLLLGTTLRLIHNRDQESGARVLQYQQTLDRLYDLNEQIPLEKSETKVYYCGALGMTSSALMLLTSNDISGSTTSVQSLASTPSSSSAMEQATSGILVVAADVRGTGDTVSIGSLCPLVPDTLSQAGVYQIALFQQTKEEKYWENLRLIEEILTCFSQRWASAGTTAYPNPYPIKASKESQSTSSMDSKRHARHSRLREREDTSQLPQLTIKLLLGFVHLKVCSPAVLT
jgi:hypothetical protein